MTYVRMSQILVQNPLVLTLDDVVLLRLLTMHRNIVNHLNGGVGIASGPQVLDSMRNRMTEAENSRADEEGEATILSQHGLDSLNSFVGPPASLFLRQFQLSKISARINFVRRTALAPKLFPLVDAGVSAQGLRLVLPEAELQELVGSWSTIQGRLQRIYQGPARQQIVRQLGKL